MVKIFWTAWNLPRKLSIQLSIGPLLLLITGRIYQYSDNIYRYKLNISIKIKDNWQIISIQPEIIHKLSKHQIFKQTHSQTCITNFMKWYSAKLKGVGSNLFCKCSFILLLPCHVQLSISLSQKELWAKVDLQTSMWENFKEKFKN